MLAAALREVQLGVTRAIARIVLPVVTECLTFLVEDTEDASEERLTPDKVDPRGTVFGQFEAAANRDHQTDEVFAFGFGKGRAHETAD